MLLPFGAFGHPLAQRLDLGGGQFQAGIYRRHALGLVLRSDSPDHLAGGGIPFDDGAPPTQVRLGSRFTIEAQRNFFGGGGWIGVVRGGRLPWGGFTGCAQTVFAKRFARSCCP